MDIKLKSAEELFKKYHRNPFETSPDIVNKNILKAIKEAQRNAIEVAVQRCSEDAVADYETVDNYVGLIIEQTVETEKMDPIEVYVINSSILDCKQKLFEENDL